MWINDSFNGFINCPLPCSYCVVSEFNKLVSCIGVFCKIEEDDSLALSQVHALYFDWWKHTLDHQGAYFVWIWFIASTETIHYQQRCCLKDHWEYFRVLFVHLLKSSYILCQTILAYFKCDSRTLWILYQTYIISSICLSHNLHMSNSELTSHTQKIFQGIFFLFSEFQGSVGIHELSKILNKLLQVRTNLTSFENEGFRRLFVFLLSLLIFDVCARFLASTSRFWHVFILTEN